MTSAMQALLTREKYNLEAMFEAWQIITRAAASCLFICRRQARDESLPEWQRTLAAKEARLHHQDFRLLMEIRRAARRGSTNG
jgi:hypothetical protein